MWKKMGVFPAVVVGQSVGEVAACYIAGVLDLKTAVKLIFIRSDELSTCSRGGMVVVRNTSIKVIEEYCRKIGSIKIAVYISPKACTVSGEHEGLRQLENFLVKDGVKFYQLDTPCGYHSPAVREAGCKIEERLSGHLKKGKPKPMIPIISTVLGKEISQDEVLKESYWKQNVNESVQFHKAILETRGNNENNVYIEIGPSPVLKAHLSDIFDENHTCVAIPSVMKKKENATFIHAVGAVYEMGVNVEFSTLINPSEMKKPSKIPRYFFNRNTFPIQKKIHRTFDQRNYDERRHSFIITNPGSKVENGMHIKLTPDTTPYIYDHVVRSVIVVPGAIYADVGFEIGRQLLGLPTDKLSVSFDILGSVSIADKNELELEIRIKEFGKGNDTWYRFGVKWGASVVCQGVVKRDAFPQRTKAVDVSPLPMLLPRTITADEIYKSLERVGYQYGKWLRVLQGGVAKTTECLINVSLPEEIWKDFGQYHIHPSILDGMLQCCFASLPVGGGSFFVPIGMDSLTIRPELHTVSRDSMIQVFAEMTTHTTLETMETIHYNVYLINEYKDILVQIENLVMYGSKGQAKGCDYLRYTVEWKPQTEVLIKEVNSSGLKSIVLVKASENFKSTIQMVQDEKTLIEFLAVGSECTESNSDLSRRLLACKYVILLVDRDDVPDLQSSIHVMEAVTKTIKLIQKIVKSLKSESVGPSPSESIGPSPQLFLVTQGVHATHYPDEYKSNISLLGSEVWGLYHNFVVEIFYTKVTIVDIASCTLSTMKTLVGLIAAVGDNEMHGREFCIYDKHLLGLEIRASTKRHRVPSLRSNKIDAAGASQQSTLRSHKSQHIKDPFFMYEEKKAQQVKEIGEGVGMLLELQEIFVHDSHIYPVTKLEVTDKYGFRTCDQNEEGHPIMAIEFIGKRHRINSEGDADFKDDSFYVACYPCVVRTVVEVPEECCVKQSAIQGYFPGKLSTALILWELLKDVENESEIQIFPSNLPESILDLLYSVLKETKKQCTISIGRSTCSESQLSTQPMALILQQPDLSTAYITFQKFTKVLSLPGCLPDSIVNELRYTHGIQVSIFDATSALSNERIKRTMTMLKALLTKIDTQHKGDIVLGNKEAPECLFGRPIETIAIAPMTPTHLCENTEPIRTLKVKQENLFDKLSSYIVVGGLTGVGRLIVELLAKMGAGVIATFGRRRPTEKDAHELVSLQNKFDCVIEHIQVDVTEEKQVQQAIGGIETRYSSYPIRGVFQGAGINRASNLSEMTPEHIDDVMKPKVQGTINLHLATAHLPLDYFVLLSSISALFGSFGEITYGAANSFLDGFANYRRHHGMIAQSINWGGIMTGMTQVGNVEEILKTRGHLLLKAEEFRSCFIHSLMTNETNVVYANLDKDTMRKTFENYGMIAPGKKLIFIWENDFLAEKSSEPAKTSTFFNEWIKAGNREKQEELVQQNITKYCSSVLSGDVEDMTDTRSFVEMGIDSMSSIALKNAIRSYFGVDIKLEIMFEPDTTILSLSQAIMEEVGRRDTVRQ